MTTFYVATLARYVLVDAADESEARTKGYAELFEPYSDIRERLGREPRRILPASSARQPPA